VQVEVIPTEELGDRSYVVHDGAKAMVVDPQRDLDRVERVLAERDLVCVLVAETHVHNDYVTGGYALARRTAARYLLAAAEQVDFDRYGVRDGDEVSLGRMTVRVVATPGHTDSHLAYVVSAEDGPAAVFTGGSLLYGSVGRTDLVSTERTLELTRAQYRSARRLADELPGDSAVFPTHGFGSFCSAGSAIGGARSSIAAERARNDALSEADEDSFVEKLTSGLAAYPAYYAWMGPINRRGPGPADLSRPEPASAADLRQRIAAGQWVVDLRDRAAFASDHLAGSIGIELGQQFATYLGWLIPWGSPVTFIGVAPEQVTGAQRQLARIGIDRPAGAAIWGAVGFADAGERRSYRRVGFTDLAGSEELRAGRGVVVDVRREDERAEGSIPGSAHLPLHSLLSRLDELPEGRLWVHCATGYRASIAASLLDRAGREVVVIDGEYGAPS